MSLRNKLLNLKNKLLNLVSTRSVVAPPPVTLAPPVNEIKEFLTEAHKNALIVKALEGCHYVTLNMNDAFAWGCADSEEIDASDLKELAPLLEKYGNAVLMAVVSVKRGGGVEAAEEPQGPVMGTFRSGQWRKMVKAVIDLAKDGTILSEEYWEREEQKRNPRAK